MTLNFPGPGECRIFYSATIADGGTLMHTQRLNFIPGPGEGLEAGQPFNTINVQLREGLPVSLKACVDGWVAAMQPLFDVTGNTFAYAECWAYTPGTFDARFVSAYNIGLNGTNSSPGAPIAAAQQIYTFRTEEGGILKINLLENKIGTGFPQTYTQLGPSSKTLVDYVLSGNNWIVARDTSYPFAFKNLFPGQNEKLFKKRYRA